MRVLVGCEESQAVCIAFRELGHEAYSCDIQECSGGHPEWHLHMDVFEAIEKYGPWDMGIFFPPCTYLSSMGAVHWNKPGRKEKQDYALSFVNSLMALPIPKLAIENPVGKINTAIRKPDQIINPYQFGHPYTKRTCLWLKNLSPIAATKIVEPIGPWISSGSTKNKYGNSKEGSKRNQKNRSKTFPGIAKAMAEQWGKQPNSHS